MQKTYYVYIMASRRNGTLYIGMTDDLIKRTDQHKRGLIEGFSKKHGTKTLVYYESTSDVLEAGLREKRMKKWNRQWKLELIEKFNPEWRDLYEEIAVAA